MPVARTRVAASTAALALSIALLAPRLAVAGGGDVDFAAEAKRQMNLSFDLDEVEGMLQQQAMPAQGWGAQRAPLPLEPNSDVDAVTVFRDFSGEERTVRLVDQLPVSEVDRVTVKLLETTEALPPAVDDGPGILKWKLVVPDGGEQVVDLRFSVTAPAEMALSSMLF